MTSERKLRRLLRHHHWSPARLDNGRIELRQLLVENPPKPLEVRVGLFLQILEPLIGASGGTSISAVDVPIEIRKLVVELGREVERVISRLVLDLDQIFFDLRELVLDRFGRRFQLRFDARLISDN